MRNLILLILTIAICFLSSYTICAQVYYTEEEKEDAELKERLDKANDESLDILGDLAKPMLDVYRFDNLRKLFFEAYKDRNYKRALDINKELLSMSPKNAELHRYRSSMLIDQESFDSAMKEINIAIKLDNKQGGFYYERGYIYYRLKKFNDAVINFTNCIFYGSSDISVWLVRAQSYNALGRYEDALSDLNKYLLSSGESTYSFYLIKGQAYFCLENYHNALVQFKNAVDLDSSKFEGKYWNNYTFLKVSLLNGNHSIVDSIKYFNTAENNINYELSKDSTNVYYRLLKAKILINKETYKEAITQTDYVISKDTLVNYALNIRGYAYYKLKDYKTALDNYYKAKSPEVGEEKFEYEYKEAATVALLNQDKNIHEKKIATPTKKIVLPVKRVINPVKKL